jgi:hypothetical protein
MSVVILEIDGLFKGWRRYCSERMWGKGELYQGQWRERRRTIRDAIRERQKTTRDRHHVMPEIQKGSNVWLPFVFVSSRTNSFVVSLEKNVTLADGPSILYNRGHSEVVRRGAWKQTIGIWKNFDFFSYSTTTCNRFRTKRR